ncbi:MAG: NAD kinase [Nocardioides sp.]
MSEETAPSDARERGGPEVVADGEGALELRVRETAPSDARERGGPEVVADGEGALELRVSKSAPSDARERGGPEVVADGEGALELRVSKSAPSDARERRILVFVHAGREEAREVARAFCAAIVGHGIIVRLFDDEAKAVELDSAQPGIEVVTEADDPARGCELAVVIGGDGTILRAAEIAHPHGTPLLGVNLGHVGFLAEAEPEDLAWTIDAVVGRKYAAEERLTLDVAVFRGSELVTRTFALNEASVEKAARQRMLEVVIEVDGRPLSRFGADGVVCATPTGSTAYNFSAGGPIVWPSVEALLIVPISAHALFARPMVVAPTSVLAVEVLAETPGAGVLWCDGRRTVELPPGARIEVTRGSEPVRLVRLHEAPFTDRLVAKFGLPVKGWRGVGEQRRRPGGADQTRVRPARVHGAEANGETGA